MASHAPYSWEDPLNLDSQLTDDERAVRDAAQAYCQERLAPRVLEAFRHEKTDRAIFSEMGELGLLGPTIPMKSEASLEAASANAAAYGWYFRLIDRLVRAQNRRVEDDPAPAAGHRLHLV